MLGDIGALSIAPSVYPTLPFDPAKDFSPVIMVSYSPHILAVHPSVPVSNVQELIAYAKARPASSISPVSGTGGAPHLAGIEFQQRTGVQWTYIPYKGGSQAVLDVVAGRPTYCSTACSPLWQVKNGKLKALGVSSARRVPRPPTCRRLPNRDSPGFETGSWQGVVAAAGTPRDIVAKLNAELTRILNTQDMKDKLAAQGTEVRTDTPNRSPPSSATKRRAGRRW